MGNLGSCLGMAQTHDELPIPQSVREAFASFAGPGEVMTSKQLLKFFQESQGDKAVLRGPVANLLLAFPSSIRSNSVRMHSNPAVTNPSGAHHSAIIFRRHFSRLSTNFTQAASAAEAPGSDPSAGPMTRTQEPNLELFFNVLLNPLATSPISGKVTHDMTRPLSHYYIYTGHNSYLKGNQLTSESSTRPIIKSLLRGVRVIELDLWPNRENSEILVMHGGTLTKPVGFEDCIVAIKENAFVASEYPVIITLEDHLPPNLQAKAAEVMARVLGESLYYPQSHEMPMTEFPSPFSLLFKIVVSTMPPKQDEMASPGVPGEAMLQLVDNLEAARGTPLASSQEVTPKGAPALAEGSPKAQRNSAPLTPPEERPSTVPPAGSSSGTASSLAPIPASREDDDRVDSRLAADARAGEAPGHADTADRKAPVGNEAAGSAQDTAQETERREAQGQEGVPAAGTVQLRSGGQESEATLAESSGERPQAGGAAEGAERSKARDAEEPPGEEGAGHSAGRPQPGETAQPTLASSATSRDTLAGEARAPVPNGMPSSQLEPAQALQEEERVGGASAPVPNGCSSETRGSPGEAEKALPIQGPATADAKDRKGNTEVQLDGEEGAPEVTQEALQAPEYHRLITIPGGRLRGATLIEGLRDQEFVRRISLSETQINSAAKAFPQALVRFTQRNLVRVYPSGLRVLSSNYCPTISWLHGAQMVALNMQGYGRNLWLVHGFFLANGGCGYVLKPEFYMQRKGGLKWKAPGLPREGGTPTAAIPEGSSPAAGGGLGARLERKGSLRQQAGTRWGAGGRLGDAGRSLSSNLDELPEGRGAREGAPPEDEDVFNPHTLWAVQLILRMKVVVGVDLADVLQSEAPAASAPISLAALEDADSVRRDWFAPRARKTEARRQKMEYWIKISTEGLPADVDERRLDVKAQANPSWEEQELEFGFALPELALLCVEVFAGDKLVGQVVLPVASLLPGFRCVSLHNKKGKSLVKADEKDVRGPRLLCHFHILRAGDSEAPSLGSPLSAPSSEASGRLRGSRTRSLASSLSLNRQIAQPSTPSELVPA